MHCKHTWGFWIVEACFLYVELATSSSGWVEGCINTLPIQPCIFNPDVSCSFRNLIGISENRNAFVTSNLVNYRTEMSQKCCTENEIKSKWRCYIFQLIIHDNYQQTLHFFAWDIFTRYPGHYPMPKPKLPLLWQVLWQERGPKFCCRLRFRQSLRPRNEVA